MSIAPVRLIDNIWHACDEADATGYAVINGPEGGVLFIGNTFREAEDFILAQD